MSATSKLTVTALRKLAKERGIDVPAGIRKADLVKLIDETPSVQARVLDVANVRQGEAALRSTQSVQDALHRAELLPRTEGGIRPREMFALQDTVYDPDFGYAKNGYRTSIVAYSQREAEIFPQTFVSASRILTAS